MHLVKKALSLCALLLPASNLLADDHLYNARKEVMETILFTPTGKPEPNVMIYPAVVYGKANLFLDENDNTPLFTVHEFTVASIFHDPDIKMHRAFALHYNSNLQYTDPVDTGNGVILSDKSKKVKNPTELLMLDLLTEYFDAPDYIKVLVNNDHTNDEYLEYNCNKSSKIMTIEENAPLDCKYNRKFKVEKGTLTTKKSTTPSYLLNVFTYAAYTKVKGTDSVATAIIDRGSNSVTYSLYNVDATEAYYNQQVNVIGSTISWFSIKADAPEYNEDLLATQKTLDKCKQKNLSHETTTQELLSEINQLKEELRTCK